MSLEGMVCPNCGAQLHFEGDKEYCFCSSCGTQVFKDDENTIKIKKTIINEDKAKIIEAENRIKELEFKERESIRNQKNLKFKLIIGLIVAVLYIALLAVTYINLGEFYPAMIVMFTVIVLMYYFLLRGNNK